MTGLSKSISNFDRNFDEASCNKYYLSIRIRPDGLFYSIYNPEESKYIGFEGVLLAGASEVYSYIDEHPFLRRKFLRKACIFPAYKYTLMPVSLIIKGKEEEYFDFAHQKSVNEVVNVMDLISNEIKMIYAMDTNWSQLINDHFNDALKYPATAAFIDTVLFKYRTSRTSGIFINIYDENFDLLILEEGKLKYCNNFIYKSDEDLVYYTIFVIEQLNINADKLDIRLSGSISDKSAILKLLKKYIRSVELLDYEGDVRLSYALTDIPLYVYPELFNSRLCEL